jgi:hypothetical protein
MGPFTGVEPLVGEVIALRTFRVDESGLLLPLYCAPAWYDGVNTATCAPPTGESVTRPHPVPDPWCECGFYAYGSEAALVRQRQARYVQAAVSCWGGVVAGTDGLRAEHARIDALWLHRNVPRWVRLRVASRYPSARIYTELDAMLTQHPPSMLPCYTSRPAPRRAPRVAAVTAGLALLGLGVLPVTTLRAVPVLWLLWLVATAGVGAVAAWLLFGSHGAGHRAAAYLAVGVFAWLLAPVLGLPGWLLRVPLLRGIAVVAGGYLLSLRPGYFPLERPRPERAFCGVHA